MGGRCDTVGGKEQSAVTLHADRACARFGHSELLLTRMTGLPLVSMAHYTLTTVQRHEKLHYDTPFVYMLS